MYVKHLEAGGEIRLRVMGEGWTLTAVTEGGKGVALGMTGKEAEDIASLLTFEDRGGFVEEDTGVINLLDRDGEQHEKESTP